MSFTRQQRYLVAKIKDVNRWLTPTEKSILDSLLLKLEEGRANDNKEKLKCVVVEGDWPEYEMVWKVLEARVEAQGGEQ